LGLLAVLVVDDGQVEAELADRLGGGFAGLELDDDEPAQLEVAGYLEPEPRHPPPSAEMATRCCPSRKGRGRESPANQDGRAPSRQPSMQPRRDGPGGHKSK